MARGLIDQIGSRIETVFCSPGLHGAEVTFLPPAFANVTTCVPGGTETPSFGVIPRSRPSSTTRDGGIVLKFIVHAAAFGAPTLRAMAASSALSDADSGALLWSWAGGDSFATLDGCSAAAGEGEGVGSGVSGVVTAAAMAMGSVATASGFA